MCIRDRNKADQDLRDVLAHGLMDEADKKQVSTLLQSGRSNSEIAYSVGFSLYTGPKSLNKSKCKKARNPKASPFINS